MTTNNRQKYMKKKKNTYFQDTGRRHQRTIISERQETSERGPMTAPVTA